MHWKLSLPASSALAALLATAPCAAGPHASATATVSVWVEPLFRWHADETVPRIEESRAERLVSASGVRVWIGNASPPPLLDGEIGDDGSLASRKHHTPAGKPRPRQLLLWILLPQGRLGTRAADDS